MAKTLPTTDRTKCGIPIRKNGDKIKLKDIQTGNDKEYSFLKETIIRDDDDNIIGVQTEWQ